MTAGDDIGERDFETNPYTKDERRVAEYIAGLGVGGGDDPIGFILASHAALAAAGPGREKTEKALRQFAIGNCPNTKHCVLCRSWWYHSSPEKHAPECALAMAGKE